MLLSRINVSLTLLSSLSKSSETEKIFPEFVAKEVTLDNDLLLLVG